MLTQLRNLELAGLTGTPKHWRLQRACNLLHNDMKYAMWIYRLWKLSGWGLLDLGGSIIAHIQRMIYSNIIEVNKQQGTSWIQFAANPPPVLIMYRSFIAQTTTNTDPPRAAHGIHRTYSVITCAGHC